MVLLTYCIPCQHGDHEHHHEVVQAVPEGMLGGVKCRCKGECVERHTANPLTRTCPLCDGDGCEECDRTGQKVRTHIDAGDGITISVSGSAPLSAETVEAFKALARAVQDDRPEPTSCDGCGDADPAHWREGGWYCEGCAACEVCQSPYCDIPEHAQ